MTDWPLRRVRLALAFARQRRIHAAQDALWDHAFEPGHSCSQKCAVRARLQDRYVRLAGKADR